MSAATVALHTGAHMPLLGLGTWKSPPGAVHAAVVAAIEAGYRHIDCAAIYGNEAEVGAGIAEAIARGLVKREELFVVSKLWVTKCFPEEVAPALEKTLSDLKLDYLDAYLIHWPFFMAKDATFPPAKDKVLGYNPDAYLSVWREMEKAVDGGKVRAIGTSNMSARKLTTLLEHARIKPATNQVECHPFLAQRRLLALCKAHGIVLTAYSPLGSPDSRRAGSEEPAPLLNETVLAIASKRGKTPAQVLLRWQVQRGVVAIPKSVTPSRIAENAAIFDWELSAEEVAAIDTLDCGCRLIKGASFTTAEQGDDASKLWDEDWEVANIKL